MRAHVRGIAIACTWLATIAWSQATFAETAPPRSRFINVLTIVNKPYREGDFAYVRTSTFTWSGRALGKTKVAVSYRATYLWPPAQAAFRRFAFGANESSEATTGERDADDVPGGAHLLKTHPDGAARFKLEIPRHLRSAVRYDFTSDAILANGDEAGAHAELVAKPTRAYVGISAPRRVTSTDELHVRVVACGFDGDVRIGRKIAVRVASAMKNEEHVSTIYTRYIVSMQRPSSVTLARLRPGDYRLTATFADERFGGPATSVTIAVVDRRS